MLIQRVCLRILLTLDFLLFISRLQSITLPDNGNPTDMMLSDAVHPFENLVSKSRFALQVHCPILLHHQHILPLRLKKKIFDQIGFLTCDHARNIIVTYILLKYMIIRL